MKRKIFFATYLIGLMLFLGFFVLQFIFINLKVFGLSLFFWGNIFAGMSLLIDYYTSNRKWQEYQLWWQNIAGFHCLIQSLMEFVPFNKMLFLSLLTTITTICLVLKYHNGGSSDNPRLNDPKDNNFNLN